MKTLCQKIFGIAVSHFANLDLFRPSIEQQSLNVDEYECLENIHPQTRYMKESMNSNQHLSIYNLVSGNVRHVTCLQTDNARCCIMEIPVPETFGIIDMLSLSLRSQPRTDSVSSSIAVSDSRALIQGMEGGYICFTHCPKSKIENMLVLSVVVICRVRLRSEVVLASEYPIYKTLGGSRYLCAATVPVL